MLLEAKNGTVKTGNTDMDFISFGRGKESLIMLPGLGDGLQTVKGKALIMAMLFREYGKHYRVYVFSRKNKLEKNDSIQNMAKDQWEAMKKLGIHKAHIIGISQGGMIAQCLTINYPDTVNKLVLAVSLSRQNEMTKGVISSWIKMAKANDTRSLLMDVMEKSYTEKYKKRYKPFYPILGRISRPKDFNRFIIQANAILQHNAYEELEKIKSETLIVGAGKDEIVGMNASREMAEKIAGSKLVIYESFGHGVYEEAKDFHKRVLEFLRAK